MPSGRPVRIASWPHWYAPNPYLDLFYRALEPYGVEHVRHLSLDTPPMLASRSMDALHLHWPYPYWRDGPRTEVGRAMRVWRLARRLRALRDRGIPVLWTVHNLSPHEGTGMTDRSAYRMLHRTSDLRIFHSEWSREEAFRRYGRGRGATLIMPHGNYDGVFPAPAPREVTLRSLGIPPGRKLLLCFGQIRAYKGFDVAVAAMAHLPPGTCHLVIAGRSVAGAGEKLESSVSGRSDVCLRCGDLTQQELANLLAAADVVLLPYRHITGSGALLAALTMGRAVVASDLPYFREVLGDRSEAGLLVPSGRPSLFADAITRLLARPEESRTRAARKVAETYDWPHIVEPVARWIVDNPGGGSRLRGPLPDLDG